MLQDVKASAATDSKKPLTSFPRDKSGSVTTIVALSLPFLIGFAGLVGEFGYAALQKSENQRVADTAAYAGAVAYGVNGAEEQARHAAERLGALNGMQAGELVARIVESPRDASRTAVEVTITRSHSLYLSRILYDKGFIEVISKAYAEAGADSAGPGCILALDPADSGLKLSGGTAITADKCTVSSNSAVEVPCGTYITTERLNYGSASAPSNPCGGVRGPNGGAAKIVNQQTPDPLEGSAEVAAAVARFKTVAAIHVPASGGGDIEFGWNQPKTQAAAKSAGCVATMSSSKWTLSCSGKHAVSFGNMTVGGGISVDFALDGNDSTSYSFTSIQTVGTVKFGPGSYAIAKGILVGSGSATSFGSGHGNSYRVGPANNGAAISVAGGSSLSFAGASGSHSLFEVNGDIKTGGGSCLEIPVSAHHDIDGSIELQGGAVFGSGVYTINGFMAMGPSGGAVNCWGRNVSLEGTDVNLIISGKSLSKSGACNGYAFCVSAGYNNVKLLAPTSGPYAKLAVVGPMAASIKGGSAFTQGASNAGISGVVYFPNGPILFSGGASASGSSDPKSCLQLIGTKITLSGGTTAASACIGEGGAKGGKVRLVK